MLFAALVIVRVRYWGQLPVGEENCFSQLGLWGYRGLGYHAQLPTGWVDGVPFSITAEHPSAPYWWFYGLGVLLQAVPGLSTAGVICALRVMMSVIFSAVVTAGFHLCAPAGNVRARVLPAVACFVLFSTPFWVGASLQLQQDGLVGMIPYVVVYSAGIARGRDPSSPVLCATSFIGGFLVAFDKPERALLFVGAAAASYLLLRVRRTRVPLRTVIPEGSGFVLGLALVLICDRIHWLESFDVARRIAAADGSPIVAYVRFAGRFIPLAFVAFAVVTAAVARAPAAVDDPHGFRTTQLAVFVALSLAAAFRLRWHGDGFPRYFAPWLAPTQLWLVMQCSAILRSPATGFRRIGRMWIVPLFGLTMWQTWMHFPPPRRRSITSVYGGVIAAAPPDQGRRDCVPLIGLEAMNWQTGSWAIAGLHGATAEDRARGLGGKRYCE